MFIIKSTAEGAFSGNERKIESFLDKNELCPSFLLPLAKIWIEPSMNWEILWGEIEAIFAKFHYEEDEDWE